MTRVEVRADQLDHLRLRAAGHAGDAQQDAGLGVSNGVLTGWRNHITIFKALAVSGSRAALYGGYGPDRDRLAVGLLNGDRFQQTGEYRLVLPGGEPLPTPAQVIGRGPYLHLLTEDDWYQLAMSDLPAGTTPAADRASHA